MKKQVRGSNRQRLTDNAISARHRIEARGGERDPSI